MAVKASPEAVREMKRDINKMVQDIERISASIKSAVSAITDWEDSRSAEFKSLMQRVAQLTEKPTETLRAAMPKLEKLAEALDQYNKVNF